MLTKSPLEPLRPHRFKGPFIVRLEKVHDHMICAILHQDFRGIPFDLIRNEVPHIKCKVTSSINPSYGEVTRIHSSFSPGSLLYTCLTEAVINYGHRLGLIIPLAILEQHREYEAWDEFLQATSSSEGNLMDIKKTSDSQPYKAHFRQGMEFLEELESLDSLDMIGFSQGLPEKREATTTANIATIPMPMRAPDNLEDAIMEALGLQKKKKAEDLSATRVGEREYIREEEEDYKPEYDFLDKDLVRRAVEYAKANDISNVATSAKGFWGQWKSVGSWDELSGDWLNKRDGFVARHMKQRLKGKEGFFDDDGKSTRRGISLAVWGYHPYPDSLSEFLEKWKRKEESSRDIFDDLSLEEIISRIERELGEDQQVISRSSSVVTKDVKKSIASKLAHKRHKISYQRGSEKWTKSPEAKAFYRKLGRHNSKHNAIKKSGG